MVELLLYLDSTFEEKDREKARADMEKAIQFATEQGHDNVVETLQNYLVGY